MITPVGLAMLALLGAACWFFVFNKHARCKYLRARGQRDGMTEEEKEMNDAPRYVLTLVLALTCTVAFIAFSVAAVVRLFR